MILDLLLIFSPRAVQLHPTLALLLSLSLKLFQLKKHAENSALKGFIHILACIQVTLQSQIDGD